MTSIKQRISKTIEHLNHVNTTLQYTPPLACFFIRETAHIKQRMEKYINGENFNLSRSVGSSLSTSHTAACSLLPYLPACQQRVYTIAIS